MDKFLIAFANVYILIVKIICKSICRNMLYSYLTNGGEVL